MCAHEKMRDAGLLALRIALGILFVYMGYSKLGPNHAMSSGMFAKFIGPEYAGSFWAYFVGLAEFVGGLMVLLGVFASYAAAWLSIIMVVALLTVHLGGPVSGYFLPLVTLGGTLALMGSGAGCWRLVKTECHCPKCKSMCSMDKCDSKGAMEKSEEMGGCCGKEGGCCEDKK